MIEATGAIEAVATDAIEIEKNDAIGSNRRN